MDASYPIRPIVMSELPQFMRVGEHAFNSNWSSEQLMEWEKLVFEPERSLAAFDGDQIVGTTTAISFDVTVPGGGQVGTAGRDRRRGAAVTSPPGRALLADESPARRLRGRPRTARGAVRLRVGRSTVVTATAWPPGTCTTPSCAGEALLPKPANRPRLRIYEPKEAAAKLKQVHDAVQVTRPGMLTRHQHYWEVMLADPEFVREGNTPTHCVVAEDETGPRGYALYSGKPKWSTGALPEGELHVRELFGLDRDTTLTLWADLFSRDLIGEVSVRSRPVDDPLLYELADPRRTRATIVDGLYIRLVDLPVALTSRVVLQHRGRGHRGDRRPAARERRPMAPRRPADRPMASSRRCERTTAEPDLVMPVVALGAAYLGGTRLGGLADAGSHHRGSPGRAGRAVHSNVVGPSPLGTKLVLAEHGPKVSSGRRQSRESADLAGDPWYNALVMR